MEEYGIFSDREEKSGTVSVVHGHVEAKGEVRGEGNTRMIACSRQSADLARAQAHLPVIRSETARCFADPCIVTSLVYFIVPHSASIVRRLCTPTNTKVPHHCTGPRVHACTRVSLFLPSSALLISPFSILVRGVCTFPTILLLSSSPS